MKSIDWLVGGDIYSWLVVSMEYLWNIYGILILVGGWYTYPSEKYELVDWDDDSKYI